MYYHFGDKQCAEHSIQHMKWLKTTSKLSYVSRRSASNALFDFYKIKGLEHRKEHSYHFGNTDS